MSTKKNIEVCFSPALFENFKNIEAIVVVVDILRATSAIVAAFMNGAKNIIPVETLDEAKQYKEKGYMVAAERDGEVKDFADFGNSPFNFTEERVNGNDIVYSTTNGTQAIQLASDHFQVLVGSYLNFTALVNHLIQEKRDIIILCAGWKNKFNLEDTLFAGALVKKILNTSDYTTICDSTYAAMDLWSLAKPNILAYVDKAAQRNRLKKLGLDDVLEFCHTFDLTDKIPVLENNRLVLLKTNA